MNIASIILWIIIILEAALAVTRILVQGEKIPASYFQFTRARFILRAGGLVVLILLAFTPVIDFSFKWFGLYLILILLTCKSGWGLLHKKELAVKSSLKIIFSSIAFCLLFFLVLTPALIFPQWKPIPVTGPYKVATTSATYTSDTIKNPFGEGMRYINVSFWYPKDASETYPLLVFSHGAFGIRNSNLSAYEELASHGYVVCSIDHPGHSFYTKTTSGKLDLVNMTFMKEMQLANTEDGFTTKKTTEKIKEWTNLRCDDMNLAIDSILAGNQSPDLAETSELSNVYSCVNPEKIGVFGHSMGAAAAVNMPRIRNDIDAVINIDGPYFSEVTYDEATDSIVAKRESYKTPILNIYSDQVWVQLEDGTSTGVYAGNKIADQICSQSYTVHFKGTKHLSLTDLSLVSPFLTNLLNQEKDSTNTRETLTDEARLMTQFFDAMLKGTGEFQIANE